MLNQQLHDFITQEYGYLTAHNPATLNADTEKRAYGQLVKLNEEVGELCEAVLASYDQQRASKQKTYDVEAEIADVLLVTLILAEHLGIDADAALERKIARQLARRSTD